MKYCLITTLWFSIIGTTLAQDLKWVYTTGGGAIDVGTSVALDNQQLIYDLTNFRNTVNLPGNPAFVSRGAEDILIRKSTSFGTQMWIKQLGSRGQDLSMDIAVETSGNIFVSGTFEDSLFLGNQFLIFGNPGRSNGFILKLNDKGDLIWVRKLESDIMVAPLQLSCNTLGELLVSGNFEGSVTLGPGFNLESQGLTDVFIMRMTSTSGVPVFTGQMGGLGTDRCNDMYLDEDNLIFLTGQYSLTADFDPSINNLSLTSQGNSDLYMCALSPSGSIRFAKSIGSAGPDSGNGIVTDTSGNIFLTGSFSASLQILELSSTLTSAGETDVLLIKADNTGSVLWANRIGGIRSDEGRYVRVSENGIIYMGGIYRDKVDFNPAPMFNNSSESLGSSDVFVTIMNQDGTYNDHYVMGGAAAEQLNGMVLKKNGEIITCGAFGGTVDFDPGSSEVNIFSNGSLDGFLWNVFVCVNPYINSIYIEKQQLCPFENVFIRIEEGYLNGATQWSWQRGSCDNITFASGSFLNIPVFENTSFFLKGSGGCISDDSCRQIDITIFSDSIFSQTITLCQGDSVVVGNSVYYSAGSYIDSLTSVSGCDSTVFTEILVFPKYLVNQSFEICNGASVTVGNSTYSFPGTYTNHFTTSQSCDSTVVTTVIVLPSEVTYIQQSICDGESITIGNQTYNSQGTFIQVIQNSFGCEDVLIITIKVIKEKFNQSIAICQGESIQVGSSVYSSPGTYIDNLSAASGCDSIIVTQLSVNPVFNLMQSFTICYGDSVWVGNNTYTSSGVYVDSLLTISGCDSIVVSEIIVKDQIPVNSDTVTICTGDSIVVGSSTYFLAGTYIDSLQTSFGCDSVVITNLSVLSAGSQISANICNNETYDFYGNVLDLSGIYTHILTNVLGCDSIITLTLNVYPTFSKTNTYLICEGQSVIVGNNTYNSEGIFRDTLSTVFGCDSIIISEIYFKQFITDLSYEICEGAFVTVNNKRYEEPGEYFDTLRTTEGCDSTLRIKITEFPKWQINITREICFGDSLLIAGQVFKNGGKYSIPLQTMKGCDSIIEIDLKVINFVPFFQLINDTLKTVVIQGASYQWYLCTGNGLVPLLGATQPLLPLIKSDRYALEVTYQNCTFISPCVDVIVSSASNETSNLPIKVYPNPASNILNVDAINPSTFNLWSVEGKLLLSGSLDRGANSIDIHQLPEGYIILEIRQGTNTSFMPVIVLRR